MHDDQFTAKGPSHHTSGFKRTAFSTESPSDFLSGVIVQGARCGVVGEGLQAEFEKEGPPGSSNYPGVGVEGRGVNFGTVGRGRREALAGVFGDATQCPIGVLGAVADPRQEERTGVGILGASVRDMGNPLQTFNPIPERVDGSGIGVLGMSRTGPGVSGSSVEGNGGDFTSLEGVGISGDSRTGSGVRGSSGEGSGGEFSSSDGAGVSAASSSGVAAQAISEGNRGGVFQSGLNMAQISLVPLVQAGGVPELPQSGDVGDLLLIRNIVEFSGIVISDRCSLWLCVPSFGALSVKAFWQEVKLGNPVGGSL
jgi:hypothetical protein